MRESRNGSFKEEEYTEDIQRPKKSKAGVKVLVVIAVCVLLYFICAGAFGSWLAENIVTPVVSVFEPAEGDIPEPLRAGSEDEISSDIILPDLSLYALQSGIYEDPSYANEDALQVKAKGGAGYIYEDDYMRVIVSAYKNSSDAKAVHDKLLEEQDYETWEYTISAPGLKLNVTAPASDIDTLNNFFEFVRSSSNILESFSAEIQSGSENISEIQSRSEEVIAGFLSYKKLLLELGQDDGGVLPYILDLAEKLPECFQTDFGSKSDVEISSELKYNYIKYTGVYLEFLNQIRGNTQ